MIDLKVLVLPGGKAPEKSTADAVGLDVFAREDVFIADKAAAVVPLGFKVEVPVGYGLFLLPRSGLSLNLPYLRIANSPGLIDPDYRGEVGCIIHNTTTSSAKINKGTKICQLVLLPTPSVNIVATEELSETVRGEGGFGSTGIK